MTRGEDYLRTEYCGLTPLSVNFVLETSLSGSLVLEV